MPTEDDGFEPRFREALQDLAARVKPSAGVPPRAVHRARTRLGRNVAAGMLAVALVAVGGVRAISLMQAAPAPGPAATSAAATSAAATSAASTTTPSGAGQLPPLRVPTADDPLQVLVVGDHYAEDLETGLAGITDGTYFQVIPKGLSSTGLSRPDYYDWPGTLSGFMEQYRPDVVIVMLGGNDPQTMSTASGKRIPFDDPDWQQAYSERVDRMMTIAAANGTHVAWIGMPIMRDPPYSGDIELIDSIDHARAALHPEVAFVDTWSMFADQQGHYADRLPDRNGNLRVVRASDGIHLSEAGNRLLAEAIIQMMRENAGWLLPSNALG